MTDAQRAEHRRALHKLRDEVLANKVAQIEPNRTDPSELKVDEDAQPLNEMNQAIASGRNRSRASALSQIETALRRLDEDPEMYGLCLECEEPIEPRRLRLMPQAELCTECQEAKDGPRQPTSRRNLTDYR